MAREDHYVPIFPEADVMPRKFDGLLGWSADWRCVVDPQEKPLTLDSSVSLNPSATEMTVQFGDSLSEIAQDHGCTVKDLAQLNHLRDTSLIFPGQILKLPVRHYSMTPTELASLAAQADTSCTLSFAFEDLIEKPLQKFKVRIESAAGDVFESVTDELGKIQDYVMEQTGAIRVFVKGAHGVKEVANFIPSEGKSSIRLTSPKVRVKGITEPIKDRAGRIDLDIHPVNTVVSGRDSKGNPVIQINHTCPNKYDLLLGRNVDCWDQIIAASERSGIIPQSIGAVINAESAQINNVWNKESVAVSREKTNAAKALKEQQGESAEGVVIYASSAAGMTQFLNATWLDETFREGTYLNEQARARGVLANKPKLDVLGNIEYHPKTHQQIILPMFEAAPDTWLTKQQIIDNRLLRGITPYPPHATKALQAWLNLRFEPEFIIMAAVDYGLYNLAQLQAAGYSVDTLNDAAKAKIFYLAHHLGLGDAKRFIRKTITEENAHKLLVAQIGAKKAATKASKNSNSYVKGHRMWLSEYIDRNIRLEKFYCPKIEFTVKQESGGLESVIEKIKGDAK
ncbi:LysM peptidoglycan-binding domain-containing protein [Enterobacter sp. 638]|uniref:Peptidoglycan-binding LysM n=1 Tax=Enterobacter sp. (strain 638) TaxID=399742 RepID=A0A9J9GDT1_ENT38|nr:LysM peptidoglycan-binding domain-containing protein [Enterobacter sp. 638]ABP58870.1 Peptidoglycan-binding LysM [Enterobacter sp. 638]